jgi:hypothetical protein
MEARAALDMGLEDMEGLVDSGTGLADFGTDQEDLDLLRRQEDSDLRRQEDFDAPLAVSAAVYTSWRSSLRQAALSRL